MLKNFALQLPILAAYTLVSLGVMFSVFDLLNALSHVCRQYIIFMKAYTNEKFICRNSTNLLSMTDFMKFANIVKNGIHFRKSDISPYYYCSSSCLTLRYIFHMSISSSRFLSIILLALPRSSRSNY